jgi:predicted lactoylglutathione lyase
VTLRNDDDGPHPDTTVDVRVLFVFAYGFREDFDMIGYVTLGTNDLERAAAFYDAIAAEMGTSRMMEWPGAIAWGTPGGGAGIGLTKAFDGQPATVGNGVMVALEASSREQIHRLYDIALAHGGSCEGPPGPRGDSFYAAYFRDPDGNKLNAFRMEHGAVA